MGILRDDVQSHVWTGTTWVKQLGDSSGNTIVTEAPIVGTTKAYEDAAFVVGSSPVILDFNTDLGRNAVKGSVVNDGPGDFTVALSPDGSAFGDEMRLTQDDFISLDGMSVDSVRITHVADSAYRVWGI